MQIAIAKTLQSIKTKLSNRKLNSLITFVKEHS